MSRFHGFRLDQGGRIDRSRPLTFTFNGRALQGFAGDTIASALLANSIGVVSRSFKYHRPRGILSAGFEEPNALLRVESDGNVDTLVRATLEPLRDGMRITSENCFPSVDFDIGRMLDGLHALWCAGFYYKTFKWPSWRAYEPVVRRAAGLGTLPSGPDRSQGYRHSLHCDVLVVGGGIAGLAAALAANRTGASVVLIEQDGEFGGGMLADRRRIKHQSARRWIEATIAALERSATVRLMRRTLVAGYYDHNVLTAIDRCDAGHEQGRVERFWHIHAREVVLATGAIEQPLIFAHNDRPGILLAGAMRTYLNRYGVAVGRNVVIATHHDDAYRTAFDLHDAGVRIAAIVDVRTAAGQDVEEELRRRGLHVHRTSVIVDTRGSPSVRSVAISTAHADPRNSVVERRWIACDAVAMSSGWNPTVHLYSQAGGKVRYEPQFACLVPDECRQRVRITGAANAEFSVDDAIAGATQAGVEAAQVARADRSMASAATEHRRETFGIHPATQVVITDRSRQWVDFQHDVTTADIALAVRENYVSVEHLKRYTTNGMSVDQGKTSNLNALKLLAQLTGRQIAEVGTTTFRPQFLPVSLRAINGGAQGELHAPERHMPVHAWHLDHGALMEDYGGWRRPACYVREGEQRAQAILREVRQVREKIALFEGSPLGKIEVRGPDAGRFLHRIYMNNVLSLPPGRVRYGLMLNENGIVLDDGVFARLAPEHFLVSTTGANAERIAAWLDEWHQCEWPHLELIILPVSSQWAVLTLAGAAARRLLQALTTDIDFSADAFPHMSLRMGQLAGSQVRVQRVSFTGELSYEIAVAADEAPALWDALMQRGREFGIDPVGVEAWLVLRLEKGFLHVGSDTDGTTNPLDLGMRGIVERKDGDFIGRRSLLRALDQRDDRRQLIGLETIHGGQRLVSGAHLVTGPGVNRRSEGFVTSAAWSPTVDRSIGLALLERGFARLGETVVAFDEGRLVAARVVRPPFFDPQGARMNA